MEQGKPKSFWKRPEGKTGMLFLGAGLLGGGYLLMLALPTLLAMAWGVVELTALVVILSAIIYMALDPKMRNLISYSYRGVMRWITGIFVNIDPIGVLQSYVEDLQENIRKMNKQIGKLRGQMHKLGEVIKKNKEQIKSNLSLASKAKEKNNQSLMVLKSRKAGRLKESNVRLEDLYKKMEVLYRVLTKMYQNSEIMVEDIKDQVHVKKQEREAIRASHSAMSSAMNIISGKNDKRYMFDMALEAIAEDVSMKMGEMERFMDLSTNFMDSIDLQNGVFEEEGMKMLEKWETEGVSILLGNEEKKLLLEEANSDDTVLDINASIERPIPIKEERTNQYDDFFGGEE